jgi:hypothetical protein
MDDTIITIYCLCDDFLKAMHRFDDPQVRLSSAEVMRPSPWWLQPSSEETSTKLAGFSMSMAICHR